MIRTSLDPAFMQNTAQMMVDSHQCFLPQTLQVDPMGDVQLPQPCDICLSQGYHRDTLIPSPSKWSLPSNGLEIFPPDNLFDPSSFFGMPLQQVGRRKLSLVGLHNTASPCCRQPELCANLAIRPSGETPLIGLFTPRDIFHPGLLCCWPACGHCITLCAGESRAYRRAAIEGSA